MLNKLTPNLMVKDVQASTSFYERLGFTQVVRVPNEGDPVDFTILAAGDVELMLQSEDSMRSDLPPVSEKPRGGASVCYFAVSGVQQLYKELQDRVKIVVEMRETFYGSQEFYIEDPDGYVIGFAEHKKSD